MINYQSAKNLVSYFTTIEDVIALVRVEYEPNPEIGKDEMPEAQEVCLIKINYYPEDMENPSITEDMKNSPIAMLKIDACFDDKETGGKCVGFDLSTCADENNYPEIEQQRANLVLKIAGRIENAMDWEWLE